jgi:tRNA-2-methylthio-N6-dimethylallyladenosine synthase
MNTYDSQVAAGILEHAGCEVLAEGEGSGDGVLISGRPSISQGADIVLMNTCSVRDHAEERVWGRLGLLGAEKRERPELIIGLMGCMVEEHREKLFKRFPYLDLMVGTRHIKELPEMIRQVFETRKQAAPALVREDYRVRAQEKPAMQIARIKQEGISIEYCEYTKRDSGFHAWLPIMTGCNKECTFCIVPMTRGSEVSMPAQEVFREAERLVSDGVKWITLLGQNVNSYCGTRDTGIGNRKEVSLRGGQGADEAISEIAALTLFARNDGNGATFPELLEMLCGIDGLERISFTTSHPQDATEELFQAVARNPKIGRRFHLPLQSGSDRMLKRMKRHHTYAEYKAKIDRLRALVPEISITTDIIVGFSGETDEDHAATRHALEEMRFDSAFIYKYSVRPGTPAAQLPDDVSFELKSARNQELLKVQKEITGQKSRSLIGKAFTVFVEGRLAENPKEMIGRMDQDRRVIIEGDKDCVGQFVRVEFTGLHHETFRARLF